MTRDGTENEVTTTPIGGTDRLDKTVIKLDNTEHLHTDVRLAYPEHPTRRSVCEVAARFISPSYVKSFITIEASIWQYLPQSEGGATAKDVVLAYLPIEKARELRDAIDLALAEYALTPQREDES